MDHVHKNLFERQRSDILKDALKSATPLLKDHIF